MMITQLVIPPTFQRPPIIQRLAKLRSFDGLSFPSPHPFEPVLLTSSPFSSFFLRLNLMKSSFGY